MPAFPHRRDRRRHRSWADSQLEQWNPPGLDSHAVRVMLLGAALGAAMWVVVIAVSTLAYRVVAG